MELTAAVRDLETAVEALRGEVHEERLERRKDRRWLWATIAVIVIVGVITLGGAYYLIGENNRKWCGTLSIIAAPSDPPPATERGRMVADRLRALADDFGCKVTG